MERENYLIIKCKNYEVSVEFDNDSMRETAIALGEAKIARMVIYDMLDVLKDDTYLFPVLEEENGPIKEIHLVIEER